MATIKAPYNFVPLENEAFIPSWGNRISQDVPFKDGVSGSIDISIEAMTPIFVRNGQRQMTEEEKKNGRQQDNSFSHTEGNQYFIPGTSIKGELRDILEILSFGKMTQVQDSRFGIRDLTKGPDGEIYKTLIKGTRCGWLYKDEEGDFIIEDCGIPWRVAPEEIDRKFNCGLTKFKETLKSDRESGVDKNSEQELKSASRKYRMLGVLDQIKSKASTPIMDITGLTIPVAYDRTDYKRDIYEMVYAGKKATLIMTGQPDMRQFSYKDNKWKGKYYEFLFPYNSDGKAHIVADEIINDFKTIHKNNYDFEHLWQERLEKGGDIPVFFTLKDGEVDAIGLSFMFRYPTTNSIETAIPAALQLRRHKDLAECIFGTCDNKLGTLKGRVVISPAFLSGVGRQLTPVSTTLSSPKPSFGPLYVREGTWMSGNAQIKGRKRYPVRNSVWTNEVGTDSTATKFTPLDKGAKFCGKIHFHNLKEAELGALIAALTFNGHEECFHSIGEAKPLGYGKVKISITGFDPKPLNRENAPQDKGYYLKAFQALIEKEMLSGRILDNTASVKELVAMAKGISDKFDGSFRYMSMDAKEFTTVKSNNENLPKFSEILNGKDCASAAASKRSNRNYQKDHEQEIKDIEDAQTRKEDSAILLQKTNSLMTEGKYEDAIKAYEASGETSKSSSVEDKIEECRDSLVAERIKTVNELISNQEYEKALDIALQAQRIKDTQEIRALIEYCRKKIEEKERTGQGIYAYLPDKQLASIGAYKGKLDKWQKECGITEVSDDDKMKIVNNINSLLGTFSGKDRKVWKDKAQSQLAPYLGDFVSKLEL